MKIKKIISILVISVIIMLLAVIPFNLSAAELYSDIATHWAKEYIVTWSNYGILLGYPDGTFLPGNNITRAEMAVIINRVVDYTQRSAGTVYTDISASDWYYEALLKLHAADIMQTKSGNVKPGEKITRQEAITMIAKAFDVYDANTRSGFTDESSVASWALPYVRGMKASGYINGYEDGSLRPNDELTRAEVVTILDNVIELFYNTTNTYGTSSKTTSVSGNIVISSQDVSLINLNINGNVYITPGVGSGDVTLTGTTINGVLYVWGGGNSSIELKNCNIENTIINSSNTRVVSSGSTLKTVDVLTGIFDSDSSTKVTNINLTSGTVNLLNRSDVEYITTTGGALNVDANSDVNRITATSTAINVKATANVNEIIINSGSGSSLTVNGTVGKLESAVTLTISGNGTITTTNLVDDTDITLKSVTADGSSSALTSKLTLTFDKDIANFSINDITLTANNTGVTKGTLTKVENTTGVYELTVNGITSSGSITVKVSKSNFTIKDDSKNVNVYYVPTTNVVVSSIRPDGSASYRTSKITVTFNQDIPYLSLSDFTLDAGTTGTTLYSLNKVDGSVGIYDLVVSNITSSGNVTLSFSKAGYTFSTSATGTKLTTYVTSSSAIYVYYNVNTLSELTYYVTADGDASTKTTKLTFTFTIPVSLTTSNFSLSAGTGSASKGSSSSSFNKLSDTVYEILITPTSTNTVSSTIGVTVSPPAGYTTSAKTVTIYNPSASSVTFSSVTAGDDNNDGTTDYLILKFTGNITGLSESYITLSGTGVTRNGILTSTGTTGEYRLPITVASGNSSRSITVKIETVPNYTISSTSKTVTVSYDGTKTVTLSSVVATDTNQDGTSDLLTLTFSDNITGLTASHITLTDSSGSTITKGTLSPLGNGIYTLGITLSGTSTSRTITVTINTISNYSINYNSRTTTAYYTRPTEPTPTTVYYTVDSDGEEGKSDTTYIKIKFDNNLPDNFSTSNISISPSSGNATIIFKDKTSDTVTTTFEYEVKNVKRETPITISFTSISGYPISPSTKSVTIHSSSTPVETITIVSLTVIKDKDGEYTTGFNMVLNKQVEGLSAGNFSTEYNGLQIAGGLPLTLTSVTPTGIDPGTGYTTYECKFTSKVETAGIYKFIIKDLSNYEFKYKASNGYYEEVAITVPAKTTGGSN